MSNANCGRSVQVSTSTRDFKPFRALMFGVCFSFCLYSIDFGWFVYFSFKKLFVKAFLLTSVRELVLCRHRTTKTFRGKLTLYWNRLTSYKKYTITSTATSKIVFLNTVSISVFAALLQFFYKANSNREGTLNLFNNLTIITIIVVVGMKLSEVNLFSEWMPAVMHT